jgi:signal transduction histidine kinase
MHDYSGLMLQPQLAACALDPVNLLIVADMNVDVSPIIKTLKVSKITFTYESITTQTVESYLSKDRAYDALIYYHPYREWDWRAASLSMVQLLHKSRQNHIPPILIVETLADETDSEYVVKAGIANYVLTNNIFQLSDYLKQVLDKSESSKQQLKYTPVPETRNWGELIYQISKTLNSSLASEEILQDILRRMGEGFDVDRAILFRLDEEKIKVCQEWRASERIPSLLKQKTPIKESENDFYGNYLNKKQNRLLEGDEERLRSIVSVPIFVKEQFYGSLTLQTTAQIRSFTPEEIQIITIIAQQVAIAIDNIQRQEREDQLKQIIAAQTQAKEREKENIEISNCMKSEVLANIIHELRTPLTAILGFSRMLDEEIYGNLNLKQKEYINAVSTCGQHLLALINDLLDLSKIESDREELFLESIPVNDICLASMFIVREQAEQKGLELILEIEPQVSFCIADPRRLKQILVNLLCNGVKFTQFGSVTLKVKQNSKTIEFSAIDTGIGISEADRKKLFQPFQQINNKISHKDKGSGLGLALSRKLARLHGGDITLTSEEGKGSCFTLHLPA